MHNKGGTERAGSNCAARRAHKQGRGVIALKKQTDKQINVHLKAQKWVHRKEVGFRAKSERHDEKRASEKRAKKTKEREKERAKSERPQNERNQTERA